MGDIFFLLATLILKAFFFVCACHVGILVSVFPECHPNFPGSHFIFPKHHFIFPQNHLIFLESHLIFLKSNLIFLESHLVFLLSYLTFLESHLIFQESYFVFPRNHLPCQKVLLNYFLLTTCNCTCYTLFTSATNPGSYYSFGGKDDTVTLDTTSSFGHQTEYYFVISIVSFISLTLISINDVTLIKWYLVSFEV